MDALLITSFASFGDLLYQTPYIRFLKTVYKNVDVWARNYEPFINNPNIRHIYKMDSFRVPPTTDFYWTHVYKATLNNIKLPQSNIHTVDFFTVGCSRMVLRDKEKELEFYWTKKDEDSVRQLLAEHGLITAESRDANFTVICPSITWPSRTFSLEFYQELISLIQKHTNDKVVIVGKDIDYAKFDPDHDKKAPDYEKLKIKETKALYPIEALPKGVIDLTNKLSLHQLGALYSLTKISINTENGNHVVSCTNRNCWNLYVPTLTAPEFRLPYRDGSMYYKTVLVNNNRDYFPASQYSLQGWPTLLDAPSLFPTAEEVFQGYLLADKGFKNGDTKSAQVR